MNKRTSRFFIFCMAGLFLGACQTNKVQNIIGTERDELVKAAEPFEYNLIGALNSGDFTTFSKDFDTTMKSSFKEADFTNMRQTFASKLGDYQSRTVAQVQSTTANGQTIYLLSYTLQYSKSKAVTQRLVLTSSQPYQVTGLWYNSPELTQ